MKKKSSFIVSLSILLTLLVVSVYAVSFSSLSGKKVAQADTALMHLTGYAWSSNIGWINFGAPGYSVTIDPATGTMGGYAWANPRDTTAGTNNIGWISFNNASGCPIAPCQAQVNLSTGAVTGWARVVANDPSWDGWIQLSGTNFPSPVADGTKGSTYKPTNKTFVGYSWDSGVLGWVQLNPPGGGVHVSDCGDAVDNDGNGLIDALDPTCHFDGNPNNPNSYNPGLTSENSHECTIDDFTPTWGTCVDGMQSSTWTKLPGDTCTGNFTPATTTQQCTDNDDEDDGNGTGGALGPYTLTISPGIISKGGVCNVTWSIDPKTAARTKCTLTGLSVGSGYAAFNPKTKGYGEGLHFTSSITATYSLFCQLGATKGTTITKTCTVAPKINEF